MNYILPIQCGAVDMAKFKPNKLLKKLFIIKLLLNIFFVKILFVINYFLNILECNIANFINTFLISNTVENHKTKIDSKEYQLLKKISPYLVGL
jgi:hypothetical protein